MTSCLSMKSFSVGCGYGGFLISLGETFPDKISIGMEIRVKVCDYVQDRIGVLRQLHPGEYGNVACIRTNSMKFLTNYFHKGQLTKMFFLYPDPHFKRSKHKWRIINPCLLSEYAYVLAKGVRKTFKVASILSYSLAFRLCFTLWRMSKTLTNGWFSISLRIQASKGCRLRKKTPTSSTTSF